MKFLSPKKMSHYTIMYMGIENECIKNENIVLKNILKKNWIK